MTLLLVIGILAINVVILLGLTLRLFLSDRRQKTERIHVHDEEVSRAYTAQRQAAGDLRQSIDYLALLKSTLDAANIGVTVTDMNREIIVYVNQFDAHLHGYAPQELMGRGPNTYAPESFELPDTDKFPKIKQNTYVSLNQHRDGNVFPVRLYTSVYRIGEATYKVTFCQRIIELAPYEAFILGEQDVFLVVLDEDLHFFWANDRILELFLHAVPRALSDIFSEQGCRRIQSRAAQHDEFPHRYAIHADTGEVIDTVFSLFHGVWYYFLVGRRDPSADTRSNTAAFLGQRAI